MERLGSEKPAETKEIKAPDVISAEDAAPIALSGVTETVREMADRHWNGVGRSASREGHL
jgi:hypothetical protein